jgi:dienelactone hydrolase
MVSKFDATAQSRSVMLAMALTSLLAAPPAAGQTTADADAPVATPAAPPTTAEDPTPAGALDTALHETIVKLPVTVQPIFGDPRQGEMIVTHFRPRGDGPFPVVIMNHGRSAKERDKPARMRLLDVARYFVRRGAAVVVPTRLGYGDTGLEPDPEETGPCERKRYTVAARNTDTQLKAVADFVTQQPWADAKRLIVAGQSMGGFATVAFMGQRHPGVVAGINFAGGGGGDAVNRRGNPCDYQLLGKVFEEAGKANGGVTPMLWIYSQNDRFWGASIPRQWHEAYTAAGGKARFEMLPAIGDDGHYALSRGRRHWRALVDAFVAPWGLRAPRTEGAPAATNFAALDDASKLPHVKQEVRDNAWRRFLEADVPRAFAIGPKGEWAFRSGDDAMTQTLERCAQVAKAPCKLYAVDDAVVWVDAP